MQHFINFISYKLIFTKQNKICTNKFYGTKVIDKYWLIMDYNFNCTKYALHTVTLIWCAFLTKKNSNIIAILMICVKKYHTLIIYST